MFTESVVFKIVLPNAEIIGDTAGPEPGNLNTILAQISGSDLTIASDQVAIFFVPAKYNINGQSYTQLSWKVQGPATIATVGGVPYTLASNIVFQTMPTLLAGTVYIV